MKLIRLAAELRMLRDAFPTPSPCHCALSSCSGWTSLTEERWPAAQVQPLGTLRDPEVYEPTFEEKHPEGTRYDDPQAPVAHEFFPYNRCDVWRCQPCGRMLMRYTEYGGYYVDHRVRQIGPDVKILD